DVSMRRKSTNSYGAKLQIAMRLCTVVLLTLFVTALASAQTPVTAGADENQVAAQDSNVTPPAVPTDIQVQAGNKAYLVGHATGTQNYICVPSGSGVAYALFTPQATLFNDRGEQIITHF